MATEKRFTMKGSTILECGEEITAWDCCDLLNELHDENEHLKAGVYILQEDILNKRVRNLIEENEQLKIFLEALKEELSLANRDNDALEKENEQLKKEVEDLKQALIRCAFDDK